MNILRRLPLSRLLLLCVLVVGIGVSATAIALALSSGEKPPPKPLAQAVHDALTAPPVEGLSATVTLTNHLVEGANLAAEHGSGLTSNPLITGAAGRLWIAKDGRVRLELKAEQGDTNLVYDGSTVTVYDAAENKVYRYTPRQQGGSAAHRTDEGGHGEVPTVAKIQEGVDKLRERASLSGATPANVGGRPAYTVRIGPSETGSLIGGAELSFDSTTGVPLRAAAYSTSGSAPVVELAASDVSYGPVPDSVFQIAPPPGAKVEELEFSEHTAAGSSKRTGEKPTVTEHGHGISSIEVLQAKAGKSTDTSSLDGLPKVTLPGGVSASELRTALGTVLTFERAGVRYVVAGAVEPSAVEAIAKGL